MPELCGSTTVSASRVASAASVALPPWRSIAAPASAARGSAALTMPGSALAAAVGRTVVQAPSDRAANRVQETAAHRRRASRFPPPRQCSTCRARVEPLGKPVGDAPREARARHRPSPNRAGPGSPRRGSAPTRRRRWRSRPTAISGIAPPLAARKARSASSASGLSGAPDRPPASPAMARLERRARDGGVGDDQRVDAAVDRGADDALVVARARGRARPSGRPAGRRPRAPRAPRRAARPARPRPADCAGPACWAS